MPIMLVVYLAACLFIGWYGRDRVLGFLGFFLLSLIATPMVVGLILVLTLPRRPGPDDDEDSDGDVTVKTVDEVEETRRGGLHHRRRRHRETAHDDDGHEVTHEAVEEKVETV